jgi:hypothetical protein
MQASKEKRRRQTSPPKPAAVPHSKPQPQNYPRPSPPVARYLSYRLPKGLLNPRPRAPACPRTAPCASGRGVVALSGAGASGAGLQHGQHAEQNTPGSRVGECIGEVLPPHLAHGSFKSTVRQQAAGPVIGSAPRCFLGFRGFVISGFPFPAAGSPNLPGNYMPMSFLKTLKKPDALFGLDAELQARPVGARRMNSATEVTNPRGARRLYVGKRAANLYWV